MGISEIFQIINIIINYFIKNFSSVKPKYQSILDDIIEYFNELKNDLGKSKIDKKQGEIYLGEFYDILKKGENDENDFKKISKYPENNLMIGFNNYLKDGDYKNTLKKLSTKFLSYIDALKDGIINYGSDNSLRIDKERKLFSDFVNKNIKEIKMAYIDFMMSLLYPEFNQEKRKYLIDKIVDKLDLEKYIPLINNFFDKIDKRLK